MDQRRLPRVSHKAGWMGRETERRRDGEERATEEREKHNKQGRHTSDDIGTAAIAASRGGLASRACTPVFTPQNAQTGNATLTVLFLQRKQNQKSTVPE